MCAARSVKFFEILSLAAGVYLYNKIENRVNYKNILYYFIRHRLCAARSKKSDTTYAFINYQRELRQLINKANLCDCGKSNCERISVCLNFIIKILINFFASDTHLPERSILRKILLLRKICNQAHIHKQKNMWRFNDYKVISLFK